MILIVIAITLVFVFSSLNLNLSQATLKVVALRLFARFMDLVLISSLVIQDFHLDFVTDKLHTINYVKC